MTSFAKVVNGKVVDVISAEPEFFEVFVDSSPGRWIQTSYNTKGGVHYGPDGQPDNGIALRKNFASIGFSYDSQLDAFIPPKPFPSWVLNEETCYWEPPVEPPQDTNNKYRWDEETTSWVIDTQ